ncbi:preprotein translocase subunit YajC [Streptacidiphilus carbonis]|uniref:preprotein translocase subunit YajC n=1 Tax=Streptacidiphilus carbonis TaxID=105422 RepID=UPI0005AB6592|nr:preprotein translocase subunit YajC [Streptacidiphilus carbonis]
MNSSFLVIIVVMMGAMFLMTRSAKKKQAAASEMRNKMEPGSGIRTIGGMYALVKAVNEDSVELEVAPGVHAIYAKNAIAVVMDGAEYNRIVHGDEIADEADEDADQVEDDALAAVVADEAPVELDKAPSLEKADSGAEEDAEAAADKGVAAK